MNLGTLSQHLSCLMSTTGCGSPPHIRNNRNIQMRTDDGTHLSCAKCVELVGKSLFSLMRPNRVLMFALEVLGTLVQSGTISVNLLGDVVLHTVASRLRKPITHYIPKLPWLFHDNVFLFTPKYLIVETYI